MAWHRNLASMPSVTVPRKKMTVAKKMAAIEPLWGNLRDADSRLASPAWHKEVLAHRKRLHVTKQTRSSVWAEAKARIRKKVRAS